MLYGYGILKRHNKMEFTFNYKPEAKQRPRFGAKGKVYNPQRKKALEYKWDAAKQMRSQALERPLEAPVCVNMVFHMPMPKSWSQKRREEQLGKPMTSKPDVDNLMKWILDVLNGIAYHDDRYVTSGYFEKKWGYEGKVQISIQEQEMSLLEERRIMGDAAVEMHAALDELYHFAANMKKIYPQNSQLVACSDIVRSICLEGGLFEIYGENAC